MTYSDLLRKHTECRQCKIDKISKSNQLSDDEIINIIELNNLILVSDINKYKGKRYKLDVICKKHIEKGVQSIRLQQIEKNKFSCKYCYKDSISGLNSPMWKGGVTSLKLYLRDNICNWKKQSALNCNYKCFLTGQKFHAIHHLYGFNQIFDKFVKKYKINIKPNINDYSSEQLEKIITNFVPFHNSFGLGVCINSSIHKLFHKLYSNKDNTPNQFYEFTERLYNGEFDSIINIDYIKPKSKAEVMERIKELMNLRNIEEHKESQES